MWLLFEVGLQLAADVLPGGEGRGEEDLELVVDGTDDDVVGMAIAGHPVEGVIVVLSVDGHVLKLLVECAVGIHQFEAHGHREVRLGHLLEAVGAEEHVSCALRLGLVQVVAFHILAPGEGEYLGGEWRVDGDEVGKAGSSGGDAPHVVVGAQGSLVVVSSDDEVGRSDLHDEVFDVNVVVGGPIGKAVDAESDLRVQVVEGHPHLAVAGGGGGVDVASYEDVLVGAVDESLHLRHHVWFGLFVGELLVVVACADEAVDARLIVIGGVDA